MMWAYVLKLVILLPLVCGLMIGSLWLWRRLESRMPGKAPTRLIAVKETMARLGRGWRGHAGRQVRRAG